MRTRSKVNNSIAFMKLARIHPDLLRTAWNVKKTGKTFLNYAKLLSLAESYLRVRKRNSGSIHMAEFGVGMGGSAAILGWLAGHLGGSLTLYDVFSQIPPPSDKDGEEAKNRFQKIATAEDPSRYYGNIPDLIEVIQRELYQVCPPGQVTFVQGKYEETLPDQKAGLFHLVHVDCDWYESTQAVFSFLKDHLAPGGIIQLDDYDYWPGPKMVVDQSAWLQGARTTLVEGALVIDTLSI